MHEAVEMLGDPLTVGRAGPAPGGKQGLVKTVAGLVGEHESRVRVRPEQPGDLPDGLALDLEVPQHQLPVLWQ
jgi:hypothetical protein